MLVSGLWAHLQLSLLLTSIDIWKLIRRAKDNRDFHVKSYPLGLSCLQNILGGSRSENLSQGSGTPDSGDLPVNSSG